MHKKLLMISYHFPSDLSVGAIRPAKLAKFLLTFDWKMVLLAIP